MSIEDDGLIEDWFDQTGIRPGTQKSYRIAMNHYCTLIGKTPTELLEEAEEEEIDPTIRKRQRKIRRYHQMYIKYLKDKGIAPSTINLYHSAIRSFYESFDVSLPKVKRNRGDITLEENRSKGMSRENILKLANAAATREKALIYLMALSGMGQQEARNLTIKQLLEAASQVSKIEIDNIYDLFKYEDKISNKVLPLNIRRQKVNYDHHTFIPPEATREIFNYLKVRFYGANEKIRINDNNDFLFVNNVGKKLGRDSVVTNFRRTGEKAGFKREKGKYSFWRSHSLRAYFISTFINKTGQKTLADYLAGHKISEQDRSYWQANPKDLEAHYLKVLPDLTLDEAKVKDVSSKEYEELKSTNEALLKEVNYLKSADYIDVDTIKNILQNALKLDDETIKKIMDVSLPITDNNIENIKRIEKYKQN